MAGQRAAGQKLINFPASDEFIAELNRASGDAGYTSRSEFIRDAIIEKAAKHGFEINPKLGVAPPRSGRPRTPSSFPVADSIGNGKSGQKREFSETVQLVAEVGAEYVAPVVQVPLQPRTVPAEPLPDHTPSQREAILGSIPVAMKIARERKATDDKRAAHAKLKAAKKEKDDADRKARADAWHASQKKKTK